MSSLAQIDGAIRTAFRRFDLRTALLSVVTILIVHQIARLETFGLFNAAEFEKYDRYRIINPVAWLVALVPCVFVADALVDQGTRPFRTYASAAVLGSTLASALQIGARLLLDVQIVPYRADPLNAAMQPIYLACNFLIYGGAATIAYAYLRNAYAVSLARRRAELARLDVRRTTLELRLKSMQARIDPAFLFDTLAAIGPLSDVDAPRADRLLDDLIAFLRAALPRRLHQPSTIAQEVNVLRAYLAVVTARRDSGLAVTFAISDEARAAHLPPMLLLPLVNHLLAHPDAHEGATTHLQISARVAGQRLEVMLARDGAATALPIPEVLRDRLSVFFDDRSRIDINANAHRSLRIVVEVPYVTADSGHR